MRRRRGTRVGVVALLLVFAACSSGPSELAPGVTKEGLRSLQLGMSQAQVVAILGRPLGEKRGAYNLELEYARKPSGLVISAVLYEDRLKMVVVVDVALNQNCTHLGGEGDTWLDKCEAHIPARP
jgi:SmpA / OmlA family